MPFTIQVSVDESQLPGKVTHEIHEMLNHRVLNHKFLYDTVKQAEKWLVIHEAYSPARNDPQCVDTYDQAFQDVVIDWKGDSALVVGLGCGGGHKEVRLLELLARVGVDCDFVGADVSLPLVLSTWQQFERANKKRIFGSCHPWVLDLLTATHVRQSLTKMTHGKKPRLISFFGMIPNFEPVDILPKLASILRRQDRLLLSANLAPGDCYADGIKKVLPLYDNAQTRDWLESAFWALGFEPEDGHTHFRIQSSPHNPRLQRIQAGFSFSKSRRIKYQGREYHFKRGQEFQLFFSYRYSTELLAQTLADHDLTVEKSWVTSSGEEGVFLIHRR